MQITLTEQVGAATGYTADGETLHGPGWSADLSALAGGRIPFSAVPGMATDARREGGVITFTLAMDGPGGTWDTTQSASIGTGAPGGPFISVAPITPEMDLATARDSAALTREDFAEASADAGIITWAEASAWGTGTSLPAIAQAYIASLPLGHQDRATYRLLTSRTVRRNAPEVIAIGQQLTLTPAQIDALFGI